MFFRGAVAAAAQTFTLNILRAKEQYRVAALDGVLSARGLYGSSDDTPVVEVTGECWEVSLQAFGSTPGPEPEDTFDACLAERRAAFAGWLSALPPAPDTLKGARELAGYVMYSGVVAPAGLFKRPAMLMSKNWMDNVWSWDHVFNALALAPGHSALAWDQWLLMADQQDRHGAYPDAYNDEYAVYNFAKPPVHGWAVLELLKRGSEDARTLETVYDSLARWTRWWLEHRVLPGETLPYYLHGNDSGWDNSTAFDSGVPLMTPDLSAFLILQLDALDLLAHTLNKTEDRWSLEADRLTEALLNEWQDDHFVAKHADGRRVYSKSLLYHLPVVLAKRLPQTVLNALAKNIEGFLTDYGLATELPSSKKYRPDGYWRGPVWAPSTYLVYRGCKESGFGGLARRVAEGFCRACNESGFAENFDALSGAGLCDRAYTWTASVFLLLAADLKADANARR